MNSIIFYGAKGVVLDGEKQYLRDIKPGSVVSENCLNLHYGQEAIDRLNLNNQSDWDLLKNNNIGSDFFNPNDQNDSFLVYINLDTITKYSGVDKYRYYVGRESVRREFKKVSEWLRKPEVDSVLMNAQFVAGYAKGFTKQYTQDPELDSNVKILRRYIDLDNIKTIPINRNFHENNYNNNGVDSGFYQITLLKNKDVSNTDNGFYLGVLNMRCGPHIIYEPQHAGGRTDSVGFVSTAELEDSIEVNPGKWERYYWKRLGCREFRIPFKISRFFDITRIIGYYFEELGNNTNENAGYSTWPFWKKDNYDNRIINTLYYGNDTLQFKLLPGQGKILKVQPLLYLWQKTHHDLINNEIENNDYDFSIIPNPAENSVELRFDKQLEKHYKLQITDIGGRDIISSEISQYSISSNNAIRLNLDNVPNGNYYICIFNKGELLSCKRFTVRK